MSNAAQYIALGRDIRGGLGDIGNAKLQSAQLNYQLGRQQKQDERQAQMDAYAEPGLKLEQAQNQKAFDTLQRQNEQNNAPIKNMGEMLTATFGDGLDDQSLSFIALNNILPKVAKANGWAYDTMWNTYAKKTPDGKLAPLTRQDLYDNQVFTKSILEGSVDPGHALNDMIDRARAAIPAMQDPQQKAQASQALRQMEQQQQDPRWLLNAYHNQSKKVLQGITTLKAAGRDTSMLEESYQRILDKANKWGDRVYVDPMQKKLFDLEMKTAEARLANALGKGQGGTGRAPSATELKFQAEQAAQQQEYALRNAIGQAGELGIDIQIGEDEAGKQQIGGFLTVDQKEDLDEILADQGFKAYYKATKKDGPLWFNKDGLTVTDIVPIQGGGGGGGELVTIEPGTPQYRETLDELQSALSNIKDPQEREYALRGLKKKYDPAFVAEATKTLSAMPVTEKKQANEEKTAEASKTAEKAMAVGMGPQIGSDGNIYEVRENGQTVRILSRQDEFSKRGQRDPKTRKYGEITERNKKYDEFIKKLKDLGLYEEYMQRFGQ